ncbi:zf-HC2 domain-containing protein [bacterium]|nr:zf-HC2 domain-containing protein [bacterium]
MSDPNLMAYYDGELGSEQRLQTEQHLQVCQPCREQLAEWKALDALVRGEGPGELRPRLRLQDRQSGWKPTLRAAVCLLVLGAIWYLRPAQRPEAVPLGVQSFEVRHGACRYRVETSGARLLMVDLEDENGRAQAQIGGES